MKTSVYIDKQTLKVLKKTEQLGNPMADEDHYR